MKIGNTTFEEYFGMLLPVQDNCATQHIRKLRRLDWDEQFNTIPEIVALRPGQVVFDVGAYVGDTATTFLLRGCEVHAFEPRPDNFVCLLHNCPNAHCYNIALGDGDRYRTDPRGGNMGAYSLLPGNTYSVRLDSLNVRQLDFLKIDVEGFEVNVLHGAAETVRRLRPTIHVECNDAGLVKFGYKSVDVIAALRHLGYTTFRRVYHFSDTQTDWICKP